MTVDGHFIKIRGLGDFGGCKRALVSLLQNPSGGKDKGSGSHISSLQSPCNNMDTNCSASPIPNFQRYLRNVKHECFVGETSSVVTTLILDPHA
jgi:hypothetical protein